MGITEINRGKTQKSAGIKNYIKTKTLIDNSHYIVNANKDLVKNKVKASPTRLEYKPDIQVVHI